MIKNLKLKDLLDVKEFLDTTHDTFMEMYITENKQRLFLKGNDKLIKNIIKRYQCYGLFDGELKAILIIYSQKNFRTYLKVLGKLTSREADLIRYTLWKIGNKDLYIKLKVKNPLINKLTQFTAVGKRGLEVLLYRHRKPIKILSPKQGDIDE